MKTERFVRGATELGEFLRTAGGKITAAPVCSKCALDAVRGRVHPLPSPLRHQQVTFNRSSPSSSPTRCRQTHQRAEPSAPRRASGRARASWGLTGALGRSRPRVCFLTDPLKLIVSTRVSHRPPAPNTPPPGL